MFIHNPDYDVKLAAVRNYGPALEFIQEQTLELCREAVRKRPRALEFAKFQDEEMCREAYDEDESVAEFFIDKTLKAKFKREDWESMKDYFV